LVAFADVAAHCIGTESKFVAVVGTKVALVLIKTFHTIAVPAIDTLARKTPISIGASCFLVTIVLVQVTFIRITAAQAIHHFVARRTLTFIRPDSIHTSGGNVLARTLRARVVLAFVVIVTPDRVDTTVINEACSAHRAALQADFGHGPIVAGAPEAGPITATAALDKCVEATDGVVIRAGR
jgi:hypothetical protein